MKNQNICVIGGTGFVGSHLVHRLAALGHAVTVITRRPERHREFRIHQSVQVAQVNPYDSNALQAIFSGHDCVINLAGILNESGRSTFQKVHAELPRTIVKAMRESAVSRLLHMSALNADVNESRSRYLKSKGEGEDLLLQQPGLRVTSFRPSVIFGPGDSFFNRFATLVRLAPPVFPLACADTRFAPVYVGDVVAAFVAALNDDAWIGQRLELCGPRVYTLQQLVHYTARQIGKHTLVTAMPDFVARLQARMLGLVPGKPFSMDNYYSLQKDSVCSHSALTDLGITPQSIEVVVPAYLADRNARASYGRYRAAARREV